ncbi:sensor histidine kinase [Desulfomonile tiedjei]|uniref:histidine kinase n=1 Tax=Desulfomonile tiedjei (strain ATCC 49306 / DSM 6799 / DCB-1) TaxID=706587 RepID=I4C748_DESTA|nr:ATP-binding protein [Desulfomonile tiedjei]AFM25389.1 histidine kinase [Desulfomonile tiedjei DSM 6799]
MVNRLNRRFFPYIPSVLVLASAVFTGVFSEPWQAAVLLVIAGIAYANAKGTVERIDKAEDACRTLHEQLCRAEKLSTVDELSAGIAHEINNPLGIIAQETQWIKHVFKSKTLHKLKEIEDCTDSLNQICMQVDRCKEIVHKLLSLARELEPVIQCLDLNELVSDMTKIVKKEMEERNIKILLNLETTLPLVYSDPPLLRQVVLNLLINASHAIERDGEIRVSTMAASPQSVKVIVMDTGCGIPKEQVDKIFTPFFSTKKQGKGTGLGLAICRGIIERLGGNISVVSEFGKSTTFTIHLPINRIPQGDILHGS